VRKSPARKEIVSGAFCSTCREGRKALKSKEDKIRENTLGGCAAEDCRGATGEMGACESAEEDRLTSFNGRGLPAVHTFRTRVLRVCGVAKSGG
jgi:hypothetical protein